MGEIWTGPTARGFSAAVRVRVLLGLFHAVLALHGAGALQELSVGAAESESQGQLGIEWGAVRSDPAGGRKEELSVLDREHRRSLLQSCLGSGKEEEETWGRETGWGLLHLF